MKIFQTSHFKGYFLLSLVITLMSSVSVLAQNACNNCKNGNGLKLEIGKSISAGECFTDCNCEFTLRLKSDGNIVISSYEGTQHETKLWESNTAGKGGNILRMQADGNLVLYKNNGDQPNDAVWATGTHGMHNGEPGRPTAYAVINKNTGTMAIHVNSDIINPVWTSDKGKM